MESLSLGWSVEAFMLSVLIRVAHLAGRLSGCLPSAGLRQRTRSPEPGAKVPAWVPPETILSHDQFR